MVASDDNADRQAVLLFARHDGGRMAIPLSMVARLEEFPRSALERVGPQDVVQYRDEILPLVNVSRVLAQRSRNGKDSRHGPNGAPNPQPPPRATPFRSLSILVKGSASA